VRDRIVGSVLAGLAGRWLMRRPAIFSTVSFGMGLATAVVSTGIAPMMGGRPAITTV
jgi:hypothetical protein